MPTRTCSASSALKLWLDGADGATLYAGSSCSGTAASSSVGCWKDKSTSANHAVQATGANQPGLATVASRSVPSFDGTNDYATLTPSLFTTGTTSGTVFTVATLTDPSPSTSGLRSVLNYGMLSGGAARQIQKLANASTRVVSVGTNATAGNWTGTPGVVAAEYTSSTISIWSDGQSATTVTGLTNNTGTTYANLGSSGTPAQFWYGQIPEMIAFTGTLTGTDRRSIEEYLARKWAGIITPQPPTGVSASAGDGQATVSWTAPAWNGGAVMSSYTVTASPGRAHLQHRLHLPRRHRPDQRHRVHLQRDGGQQRRHRSGIGRVELGHPGGSPGAPTGVAATAGDTTSSVSWAAPASNGGSAISSYTATGVPSDGTLWCWGYNSNGQLGQAASTAPSTPARCKSAP